MTEYNVLTFVTQEIFDNVCRNTLRKDPFIKKDERYHILCCIEGGNCKRCGKPYMKRHVKNRFADYYDYIPTCKCWDDGGEYDPLLYQRLKRAGVPERYMDCSFANWDREVKYETNQAFQIVKRYYESGEWKNGHGIILHGDGGTGKTRCAVSLLREILRTADLSCRFVSMADIITSLIKSDVDEIDRIRNNKIVLLDDMDKLYLGKNERDPWIIEQIFRLIDGIASRRNTLIATAELKTAEELSGRFPPEIVRRLTSSCTFILFEGDDYNLKIARRNK